MFMRREAVDALACCLSEVLADFYLVDDRLIGWMLQRIWRILGVDVVRLSLLPELRLHGGAVYALCLWEKLLVSGSYNGSLKLWELGSLECSRTLLGHKRAINCVVPWGDRLASCSADGNIRVWRPDADADACEMTISHPSQCCKTCEVSIAVHCHWVRVIAVCGERLCSGSYDHIIRVWSRAGDCERVLDGHRHYVLALVVWDGVLYSGSYDHSIRAWDVETGRCELTIEEAHNNDYVSALGLWRGQLVSGSGRGELKLWDRSGHVLRSLVGHSNWVTALQVWEWLLVSASCDRTIRIWNADGYCVRVLNTPCEQWGLTIWDDQLVSSGQDGRLLIWGDE